MRKWGPWHCGDTSTILKDSSDPSLVPGSKGILSVSLDPDSASDFAILVFYVDFKRLLERQVVDSWAFTEGKRHPVGLALSVQMCSAWLLASSQVFAPYIHLSSIPVMVLISWPVAFYLIHLEREGMSRGWNLAWSF